MAFKEMSELEYRALEIDALEKRKAEIIDESAKTDVATDVLERESKLCIAEFERRDAEVKLRSAQISKLESGAGRVIERSGNAEPKVERVLESTEYRKAFMEFVCRGVKIPENLALRANEELGNAGIAVQNASDATTHVSDVTAVVPETLMSEIIRKMDTYGEIWSRVRKLNVRGGVKFPIVALAPEAKWVDEDTVPDTIKGESKTSVTFSYYQVEVRFAQTLLQNIVTIDAFNSLFVELATEALIKAVEAAIINGDGNAKPLGILKDTRVESGQKLTIAKADMNWQGWHGIKSKMKKAYRNGIFIMNQATFDEWIDGMTDANGQPIGRVNYGINGEETYRFMGKEVLTVEDSLLPDYTSASLNAVFAIFIDLNKYGVNTNQAMTIEKWYDPKDKKHYTDGSMICDGKLLDPYGVLLIKKGAQE